MLSLQGGILGREVCLAPYLLAAKMKKTVILLCSLIFSVQVFSATQSEDYLVLDNKGYFIRADPLNVYLSHACRVERVEKYVDEFCVPNWPNYTRYWEIIDNRLYLVKIENDKGEAYSFESLFYKYQGGSVWAKWFTGILSYRRNNSPIIDLNHEYYEEESVIRIVKGMVIKTFETNHKERWISYSNRLLEKQYPVAQGGQSRSRGSSKSTGWMNEFLLEAFVGVTNPEEKPSKYYPIVQIDLTANLDEFLWKEAHRELSCYELLTLIAKETETVLDITISNRVVIYEIKERKTL